MSTTASSEPASEWSGISSVPLRPFRDYYPYRPVVNDGLRLLYLYPPRENDEVRCSMFHTRALERPIYEALSYAWGDLAIRRPILVDGTRMRVGENLWYALHALRPAPGHPARCLWVDALCINQGNRVETFREVQKIVPIYAGASRVICWLGSDTFKVDAVVKLVRATKRLLGEKVLRQAQQAQHFIDFLIENDFVDAAVSAHNLFSELPYWERVWIRQELISAAEILIQCGRYTIPWEDASTTCSALRSIHLLRGFSVNGERPSNFSHFRWIHNSRSLSHGIKGPHTLLKELVACRSAKSTDPKDNVYGLFGLFGAGPDEDSSRLKTNYGLGLMDVCLQAFQYCVFDHTGNPRSDHCLDILCNCRLRLHGHSGFPSWLPDWSQHVTSNPISPVINPGVAASRGRNAEAIMQWEPNLLRCKGVCLGSIDRIGRCFRTSPTLQPLDNTWNVRLKSFKDWWLIADTLAPHEDWSRLISILSLGRNLDDYPKVFDELIREMEDILHHPELPDTVPSILKVLLSSPWFIDRRLAVSDESKLLLVPEEAREGDCICVIYGCNAPLLLREDDNRGIFQVVGDCYLEGYMDGEAIQARNKGKLRSSGFTLR